MKKQIPQTIALLTIISASLAACSSTEAPQGAAIFNNVKAWAEVVPPVQEIDTFSSVKSTNNSLSQQNAASSQQLQVQAPTSSVPFNPSQPITIRPPILFNPLPPRSEVVAGVKYTCVNKQYTLGKNPKELVTLEPNSDVLYPGALLQGGQYKLGSLRGISVTDRAPVEISTNLLTGNNVRTVQNPTVGNVRNAIGEIIQAAKTANVQVAGAALASVSESSSNKQFALRIGVSAEYLTAKLDTDFSYNSNASERIYNATIIQKAFTVSVAKPSTPAGFFSSGFTKAKYDALVQAGEIGDTPPVYVSSVTYGRILMLNVKVRTEGRKLTSDVNGSFDGGVFSVKARVEGSNNLQTMSTEIKVVAIGASGNALGKGVVTDGNLGSYLDANVSLDQYAPISYQISDLRGNLAYVGDTTEYNIRTCEPLKTNKVGEKIQVVVNSLRIDDAGDGSDGDLYGNMFIDGQKFFEIPYYKADVKTGTVFSAIQGDFDKTKNNVIYDVLDANGASIVIEGYLKDDDAGEDDRILELRQNTDGINGDYRLVLNYPFREGEYNRKSNPPQEGAGSSTLNYTVQKLCDIVFDPALNNGAGGNRYENNTCLAPFQP